jgi:beta-lactamase regulating signal transducer with metallopeptidase domain
MESLLNPATVSERWVVLLLDGALKGSLLLAGAALVTLAVRRASAASRHLVWSMGIYGLLALPVVALVLPAWHVPLLPPPEGIVNPEKPATAAAAVAQALTPVRPPGLVDQRTASWPAPQDSKDRRATGTPTRPTAEERGTAVGAANPVPWTSWVLAVWATGVFLTLTPLVVGLIGLWWLARNAQRIKDRSWVTLADNLCRELGLTRKVTLLRCVRGTMPMMWGLVRPVILVPADAEDWPAERRRLVLLHELAHVQRRDCLTQLLAQLACALYWFHPLVWLAARQLRNERERACDDQVLRAGSRPSDYALILLETARSLRTGRCPPLATVAMAQRSQLGDRLQAILDPERPRQPLSRRRSGLAVTAAAALVLPLAGLRPWACAEDKPAPTSKPNKPKPTAAKLVTVSGQVLTPEGKPAGGAQVALLTMPKRLEMLRNELAMRFEVLGQTQADAGGRFRLRLPRVERSNLPFPIQPGQMIASGKGYGFGLVGLELEADQKDVRVRLKPEQIVRGRLVDIQGAPAKGLPVHCFAVMEKQEPPMGVARPDRRLPMWPGTLITDAQGRFVVRGIGRGQQVIVLVNDDRFAPHMLEMGGDAKGDAKEITKALDPPELIEGRVTYEDTGKPVVNARVRTQNVETRTDKDGRYRLNPFVGRFASQGMEVLPAAGEPHLGIIRQLDKPKAAAKRKIDLQVPRGVLVHGRVTEAGSGKPVAGAAVYYMGQAAVVASPRKRMLALGSGNAVTTGADGSFRIAVPPGKGRLFAKSDTPGYMLVEIGDNEIYRNEPGGGRHFAHAAVPIDLKPKAEPPEVAIRLRPGVTVKGTLIGPDGKPAAGVRMLTRLSISTLMTPYDPNPVDLHGTNFELMGCDPDKAYPVIFFDEKNRLGAMVHVSGKQAGKPLTVRLERCGSAAARFMGGDGKPRAGYQPSVDLVLMPGPHRHDFQAFQKQKVLAADAVLLATAHRRYYQWNKDTADTQGRYRFPMLVPGVTYRIWQYGNGVEVLRDFKVTAGETVELGDIKVK